MSPVPVPVKKRPRGFTLIELLVVIFIIGILIAATLSIIPRVRIAVQNAQTSAELAEIATAIQQYYNDYKAYPGPIANNQLYTAADATPTANEPQLNGKPLAGVDDDTGLATDPTGAAAPYLDARSLDPTRITSSENLVLGLCGGLRVNTTTGYLEYHPIDLITFALLGSGPTASPTPLAKGAPSLNPANPRKSQAYLDVKPGDMFIPNNTINNGEFTDSANRNAADSIIPEFIDKYGEPLPILYFRTNVGGTAIAGFRNSATPGGSQLSDGNNNPMVAQYDLDQNMAYTGGQSANGPVVSNIGLRGNNPNSVHGLQALASSVAQASGTSPMTDPIDTNVAGTYVPGGPTTAGLVPGANALAYFKDPNLNTNLSVNALQSGSSNTQGIARQKDGFILISAGPDRQYGTRDDIIYPGPLQP